jgi:hypothetical protein
MFKEITTTEKQQTDESTPDVSDPSPDALEALPEQYNGWIRHSVDADDQEVQYVRAGATHVSGDVTRLTLAAGTSRQKDRPRWRVIREPFDKYGDRQSSTSWEYTSSDPEKAFQRAWTSAKKKMDIRSPSEDFEDWPCVPETVGGWELSEDDFKVSRWDAPSGESITVRRTDIQSRYAGASRLYSATWAAPEGYTGPGPSEIEFVTDALHVETVDAACAAMTANPHGLTNSDAAAVLPDIHGIGPSKGRQFQLAGVDSVATLQAIVDDTGVNATDWNRKQEEIAEKALTKQIRNAL